MNLLKNLKVTVVNGAAVAGTSAVNSTIIDMAGYDGVMFVAVTGAFTTGTVVSLKAQQNTVNSTSGMADITNAATPPFTSAAGAESLGGFVLDVYRPQQEFLRAVLTRTTANAVLDSIIAIQYCGNKHPDVQDVTTILASAFVAPTA